MAWTAVTGALSFQRTSGGGILEGRSGRRESTQRSEAMFQFTQRSNGRKALSAGFSMIACVAAAALTCANAAEPTYNVGARTPVLGNNVGGLTQFPETPITILQSTPEYHVLISTGLK